MQSTQALTAEEGMCSVLTGTVTGCLTTRCKAEDKVCGHEHIPRVYD